MGALPAAVLLRRRGPGHVQLQAQLGVLHDGDVRLVAAHMAEVARPAAHALVAWGVRISRNGTAASQAEVGSRPMSDEGNHKNREHGLVLVQAAALEQPCASTCAGNAPKMMRRPRTKLAGRSNSGPYHVLVRLLAVENHSVRVSSAVGQVPVREHRYSCCVARVKNDVCQRSGQVPACSCCSLHADAVSADTGSIRPGRSVPYMHPVVWQPVQASGVPRPGHAYLL